MEPTAAVGTESTASASAAPAATGTASGVSSGTASEAMIKAAMASEGATEKTPPDVGAASAAVVAGTIAQPAKDGKPAGTNEPPKERWDDILANARAKATEDALKPYGWAKDLNAEEATAALGLVATLRKDPGAFWRELGTMVKGGESAETKDEAFPAADVISSDGVKVHSDANVQKILEVFERKLMTKFQGELRPLLDFHDGELKTREKATAVNNAKQLAGQALTSARALPHFKEHEAAIVETLTKMDPAIRKAVGPIAAMYMAFEQVKTEKVYPTLEAEAEKKVRADYDKKAAASGIHPVGGDGKVKETPVLKGASALAAHMERLEKSNDPRFASAGV